jgi:hypothetical protein
VSDTERLAEAFIRGFQEGAEFPDDSGDGDAMYRHFRDWCDVTHSAVGVDNETTTVKR